MKIHVILLSLALSPRSSDGSFLRQILNDEKISMVTNGGIEDRALDLVLGDDVDQDLLVCIKTNTSLLVVISRIIN